MDSAAEVLLIVVSSALTVFLIVFVIMLIYLIGLLKQIRRITDKAESAAESVEAAAATFEKAASPLAILKIISNIVDQTARMRRKKG